MKKLKKPLLITSSILLGSLVIGTSATAIAMSVEETKLQVESKVISPTASVEAVRRIKLKSLDLKTDLGIVYGKDTETILNRFLELNPELTQNDIEVRRNSISDVSALIQAKKGSAYSGVFIVRYQIILPLATDLTHPNLGYVKNLNEETILNRLIDLNLNLHFGDVDFLDFTSTSVTVRVKSSSKVYRVGDSILVTY